MVSVEFSIKWCRSNLVNFVLISHPVLMHRDVVKFCIIWRNSLLYTYQVKLCIIGLSILCIKCSPPIWVCTLDSRWSTKVACRYEFFVYFIEGGQAPIWKFKYSLKYSLFYVSSCPELSCLKFRKNSTNSHIGYCRTLSGR